MKIDQLLALVDSYKNVKMIIPEEILDEKKNIFDLLQRYAPYSHINVEEFTSDSGNVYLKFLDFDICLVLNGRKKNANPN